MPEMMTWSPTKKQLDQVPASGLSHAAGVVIRRFLGEDFSSDAVGVSGAG
jgi:hypothetical protein